MEGVKTKATQKSAVFKCTSRHTVVLMQSTHDTYIHHERRGLK